MGNELIRARLARATPSEIEIAVEGPRSTGGTLSYVSTQPVWHRHAPTHDLLAVSLVQFAASEGCDLHVEGPVSSAQLDRLDELQTIWSVWRPDKFRRITLSADEEVTLPVGSGVHERDGAVIGFSGGVDAAFALAAHSSGALGRLTQRIGLGVLVVGWDLRHGDEAARRRAEESAAGSLDEYGVPLAVVSTNWQQDFCNAWFMTFNAGLMSVLHTFAGMHSAAVHATDLNYRQELGIPPYGSHMTVNHLLGSPWFPVVSTGGTHRRIERVAFLRDHPALLEGLRVCYQADAGGSNCGHCEKCVRTQLELRAVGLVPAARRLFPSPLTESDIRGMAVANVTVLGHYDDILEHLDPQDEFHPVVRGWLDRQRSLRNPRVRQLQERIAELEREIRDVRGVREVRGAPRRPWRARN